MQGRTVDPDMSVIYPEVENSKVDEEELTIGRDRSGRKRKANDCCTKSLIRPVLQYRIERKMYGQFADLIQSSENRLIYTSDPDEAKCLSSGCNGIFRIEKRHVTEFRARNLTLYTLMHGYVLSDGRLAVKKCNMINLYS